MILEITKLGEEILRKKAEPVAEVTDEIRKLADDMLETMIEANGVGLAGPQVGKNLRIFVAMADDDIKRVFINPQIIKTSEEVEEYEEGCLSIPQVYESITRPSRVTVQALNEKGRPFTLDKPPQGARGCGADRLQAGSEHRRQGRPRERGADCRARIAGPSARQQL